VAHRLGLLFVAVAVAVVVATLATPSGQVGQGRDRAAPAQAAAGTLTLAGTVVLSEGTPPPPIRRARVTITFDGGYPPQSTDTDTDGKFRFDNLPAGTWQVLAEKPGFVPVDAGPGRAVVRPTVITLGPGPTADLSLVMQRAAAMEGQVLNDKGEPAVGIVVAAVRLMYGPYGRRPAVVRQATTDDLGHYRVHTLPPGEYYLDAAPDPLQAAIGPAPAGDQRQGLARSYYPGTPRLEEARVVALAPSQEISNLDFRLTTVRMASVKGNVVDAAGRAPSAVSVRVQRVGAPPGEVRGLSLPAGGFQFSAVPPGDYWLLASAQPAGGGDPEYSAMRVSVSGQDLSGLTLSTTKGATVNGRVEADGGAALPAGLQVVAHETEFELPSPQAAPPGTVASATPGAVGADGTFAFPSLFGSRVFRVDRLPAGWALESVVLNDTDVTDAAVEPGGSARPRTLRVVVTNRTATVGGTLEAAQGGPSAGRVVVFGADPKRWGLRSRTIRSVQVHADGRYEIAGLLPGNYFIVAVDDLDDGAWNDPDVLARLQPAAAALSVTDGQRFTVALKLK
jgi:hypothetical protein